jgi:ABC-type proline/glycine betaine transport system permease subunit
MLAKSMEEFVNGLVSWLPQVLQHVAEIAVYMVFLTILLAVPIVLWLGYAVSTTKRDRPEE